MALVVAAIVLLLFSGLPPGSASAFNPPMPRAVGLRFAESPSTELAAASASMSALRSNPAATTMTCGVGSLGGCAPIARAPTAAPLGNWLNITPLSPTHPSARDSFGMTYDPVDGYVVLFGGYNGSVDLGDTWTFQNGIWGQLNVSGPSPRELPGMTYDAKDGYVLLFGGDCCGAYQGARDNALGDSWSFVHGKWTQLNLTTRPGNRTAPAMAYDTRDGYVLLFGGLSTSTYNDFSDTWSFAKGAWTHLTPSTSNSSRPPIARERASMDYDPATRTIVMFGGYSVTAFTTDSDTWTYDSGTWTKVNTTAGRTPSARDDAGLEFDAALNRSVLFGGDSVYAGGTVANDLWVFVGNNWTSVSVNPRPAARAEFGLVWDPVDYSLILTDGNLNLGSHRAAETWSFGGNLTGSIRASPARILLGNPTTLLGVAVYNRSAVAWVSYSFSGLPRGCTSANTSALPCTPSAGGTYSIGLTIGDRWGTVKAGNASLEVVFAGLIGNFTLTPSTIHLHQSFVLNVTAIGGSPPYSYSYSGLPAGCASLNSSRFTCTPNGFGLPKGWTSATFVINATVSDTKSNHSSQTAKLKLLQNPHWTKLTTRSGAPSPRDQFGMVFDAAANYVLLFGGSFRNSTAALAYNDTWVYFAGSWIQIAPAASPSPRYGFGMVYDPALKGVLLFGGFSASGTSFFGDTWLFSAGNWTPLRPPTSPHARGGEATVYDPASREVVVFGGWAGHDFGDTWTYSGATWKPLATTAKLSGRQEAAFAYDAVDGYAVLFGGVNHTLGGLADSWLFVNGTWARITATVHPPALLLAEITTLHNGSLLLTGGESGTTHQSVSTTWEYRHGQWYRLILSSRPRPAREGGGLVVDPRDGYVLLFGGSSTPASLLSTYLGDSWKLTGLPP